MNRRVSKILALLLAASALALPLSGCMHAMRLKDRAIVQAVGIDWIEEKYHLTFQYFVPEGSGGTTAFDASKLNNNVIEAAGTTITEAVEEAGRNQGKQLFFGSNRVVIIGRGMAERDILSPIQYFNSNQQLHPSVTLMVAESNAREIVSAQIDRGIVPASAIEQAAERARGDRHLHKGRMLDAVMQLESEARSADLPMIRLTKEEGRPQVRIEGGALCISGKMVDTLSDEEVQGLLWLTGQMEQSTQSLSLPREGEGEVPRCAVQVLSSSARRRPTVDEGGQVVMEVEIRVNSALREVLHTDAPSLELLRAAERAQEESIRLLTARAVERTVYQNGADVLELLRALRKYEPAYYRAHRDSLDEVLKNMRFQVKIVCNISRMGLEEGDNKR